MSTEFFNDQWRIPSNENQNKVSNYSMEFNGTSDFISVNNSNETLNVDFISISAWYYPTSFVSSSAIISSPNRGSGYHSYSIILTSSGNLRIILYTGANFDQTFTSAGTLNLNQWNFICMTYDGSNVTVTLNTSSESIARTGALQYTVDPTGNIEIGRRNSTIYFITGNLDQVSIFDYGLSATQVSTLYGGGTAVTNPMSLSPAPVAYYQVGDQSADNGANYLVPNNSLNGSEGYSPYALDFDGTDQAINLNSAIALTGDRSINFWFTWRTSGIYLGGATSGVYYPYILSTTSVYLKTSGISNTIITIPALQVGVFYNMCITGDGTTVSIYINGVLAGTGTDIANITLDTIANTKSPTTNGVNGNMSNVAIWDNTVLSQSEVTEIYNSGVPSSLNTFSGTAPTSWWQLGSNSSFNTNWTCLDEIGTNNGTSVNMTNDDIVDGVGYSASGLGTSSIDIVGDAPYSTANGLSEGMDVLDRVKDTPPS